MTKVKIPMETLNRFNGSLKQVIVDFGTDGGTVLQYIDDVEAAIDAPMHRTELRGAAREIRDSWDVHRVDLVERLYALQGRVEDSVRTWQGFDEQASADLDITIGDAADLPKA